MSEIRGEYWIEDGYVNFADGDIGDANHEMIAVSAICHQYKSSIENLADELDIEYDELERLS